MWQHLATPGWPHQAWVLDPLDRNFMRIKADPKFQIPETGEYIGALPPGPAPAEGDWFTELLDRWRPEIKEYLEFQKSLPESDPNPPESETETDSPEN